MTFEEIIKALNENGIITLLRDLGIIGLVVWLIKELISRSANRKFESYKSEIEQRTREFQSTLDSKLEAYKSELTLANFKATQLHQKRLNVILELHQKMIELSRTMHEMTAFLKPIIEDAEKEESERIKGAGDAYNEFMKFFFDHKIYLPKEIADKIEEIRSGYFDSYSEYTFGRRTGIKSEFTFEKSKAASKIVREKLQPAIEEIESEFRHLIGAE
jgi:hypothetical protein